MKSLTVSKLLIPTILVTLASGCAQLPKSQSLLDAESAYSYAANSPSVLKYATPELNTANKTLMSAKAAENKEDMASLAYIANTQIETAVTKAEAQQAHQNAKALMAQKEQLIVAVVDAKKMSEQEQLAAMQQRVVSMEERNAEREILLAFGKIEFVTGTADLVPGAVFGVDLLAEYMTKYPTKTIVLSGHTDSVGSAEKNKELSQQRANFIRNVLMTKGVDSNRIIAIGYGQSQPIASNTTTAGRQKNRRIEIKFNN
ncbi:MAG: OmpA family protein [Methylococcaceae bacterium]|nr:OmpA family protein [Methylococcaceae bacterium]